MSTTSRPRTRWTASKRSHSSPALAWRNHTRSPTRSAARPSPGHRRLHLARALLAVQPQPGREHGRREPVGARRAGGEVAAAEHRRHLRGRPPHDRQREQRRGARRERPVGVEQRRREEPGARRDLGHRGLGGGALDRARAAAVDEAQRRDRADRGDDLGAPRGQLARRGGLHRGDRRARERAEPARRPVAEPGDVRLVAHQPVEHELRAAPRSRAPAPRPPPASAAASAWPRSAPARRAAASPRRRRCRPAPAPPPWRRPRGSGRGARRSRPSPSPAPRAGHRTRARAAPAGRPSGRRRRRPGGRARRATAPRAA